MPTRSTRIVGVLLGTIALGLIVSYGLFDPTAVIDGIGALLYAFYPIVLLVLFVLLARRLLTNVE